MISHKAPTLPLHQGLPCCFAIYYVIFLIGWSPTFWQVHDANVLENPFSSYRIGQTVTAKVVAKPNEKDGKRMGSQWELSVRPKMLTGKVCLIAK